MDGDKAGKKDGAAAVTDGVKDAAAHSPAAEGVAKPVQTELSQNVKDETEGWQLVFRPKRDAYGTRVAKDYGVEGVGGDGCQICEAPAQQRDVRQDNHAA
jgi:hypothetical protein